MRQQKSKQRSLKRRQERGAGRAREGVGAGAGAGAESRFQGAGGRPNRRLATFVTHICCSCHFVARTQSLVRRMWHAGCGAPCVAWCVCEECLPAGCAYFVAFRAATNCRQPPRAAAPPAGGVEGERVGGGARRRQAATHVSAVQIRLRQFTKHETRQSRGVQERGGEVDREREREGMCGRRGGKQTFP